MHHQTPPGLITEDPGEPVWGRRLHRGGNALACSWLFPYVTCFRVECPMTRLSGILYRCRILSCEMRWSAVSSLVLLCIRRTDHPVASCGARGLAASVPMHVHLQRVCLTHPDRSLNPQRYPPPARHQSPAPYPSSACQPRPPCRLPTQSSAGS